MKEIPTIKDIRDNIIADIEAADTSAPIFARSIILTLATAMSGVLWLLYRLGSWVYDQIFTVSADAESLTLTGQQLGILQLTGSKWRGPTIYVGAGTTPPGTLWTANGQDYLQETGQILEAVEAGIASNLADGAVLNIVSPIAGAPTQVEVVTTTITGVEPETVDAYRARILVRQRNAPQGGAIADFVGWTLEVPGIVDVRVSKTPSNQVIAYPLKADPDRLPTTPELQAVGAYLNDPIRHPFSLVTITNSFSEQRIAVIITNLSDDTPELRAAITEAITAHLLSRRPKQYADDLDPINVISAANIYSVAVDAGASHLVIDVSNVSNGQEITLTGHTLLINQLAKLDSIQYIL